MTDWHVYMIRCRGGTLYTGIATDVARRYDEHRSRGPKCAKYLRGRAPLELVFTERVGARSRAQRAERAIKKLPRFRKEQLVNGVGSVDELLKTGK